MSRTTMQPTLPQRVADRYQPITSDDALFCNMYLPLRRTFYPLGFAVEIVTNDPRVLEAASESFGHRRLRRGGTVLQVGIGVSEGKNSTCPPESTGREYNHLYSLVADANNQAILDLLTCTSFVWLEESAVNNRLYFRYNFLEKVVYLLLGASVVTDLHAACVSKNGRGILLCGDSGVGKSTLAYACSRAGWTYTSDDTSYLIHASSFPCVVGHSHRVRFQPTAKELFPELKDRMVTSHLEGKSHIEIPVSELPILTTAVEARVHSIVYLNRRRSGKGKLVPLAKGEAPIRMNKELFSAGEIRARRGRRLEAFSNVPAFELEYRSLDQAIAQLDLLTQSI